MNNMFAIIVVGLLGWSYTTTNKLTADLDDLRVMHQRLTNQAFSKINDLESDKSDLESKVSNLESKIDDLDHDLRQLKNDLNR